VENYAQENLVIKDAKKGWNVIINAMGYAVKDALIFVEFATQKINVLKRMLFI
jgi:hypothetical protein